MIVRNVKEFNRALRILRDCSKKVRKDKQRFDNVVWIKDNKMYATNGVMMAIADVCNSLSIISESEIDCMIPGDSKVNESIEAVDSEHVRIDGKLVECERFDAKFYKKVMPTAEPVAEILLDFQGCRNLNLGFDRTELLDAPYVEVCKSQVMFDYKDELETVCTVEDCVSMVDDGFPTLRFYMREFFNVMKASKKFKIQYYGTNSPARVVADNFEFIFNPMK